MRIIRFFEIKNLINHFKTDKLSMRRRFAIYIVTAISTFLALLLILLNIFGILNPTDRKLSDLLDTQLSTFSEKVEHDIDAVAAYAISFSEQLNDAISQYMVENHIDFDNLKDNADAINNLQNELYNIVYLNMQMSPSSGAFYILNTTVNSRSETPYFSGLYLKYINLYSENTVNNEFTLYRGSAITGKNNNISFHSGWQNESKTDFFKDCDAVFQNNTRYILSSVTEIPETWESARYIYVPIRDIKENIIGVCGFELNNLYFKLTKKTTDKNLGHVVYALLDNKNSKYYGQFTSSGYNVSDYEDSYLRISQKNNFDLFDFGNEKCIGKSEKIRLGNDLFTVSVMITEAQYKNFIQVGQRNFIIIFLIIAILAFSCCAFLSKKYISPLLRKIEQVKSSQDNYEQIKIIEIDDLFAFLSEKDTKYEEHVKELEYAKKLAEDEAENSRLAYEKALKKYELAKSEIEQLSEKHKKEIVLEDYEYFLCNLGTLTPSEYRIYELYLEGKNVKQIAEIVGITENTLKFHNKNIYSKLGISSRKQLLKFAALKKQQDKKKLQSE